MNPELREQLGQAVYAAQREVLSSINTWEQLDEDFRELNRLRGEAAVSSFMSTITPPVMYHLVVVTNEARGTRHLYVAPGDNSMRCALDACEEHQRLYGGNRDDLRMVSFPPVLSDRPIQVMQLD